MKFNCFKETLAAAILYCFIGSSNAGLIHNNTEFLSLSETYGLTETQLNTLISQSGYEGYSVASRVQVSSLFTDIYSVVQGTNTATGYYGLAHLTTGFGLEMSNWLRSGFSVASCCNGNTENGEGNNVVDTIYSHYMRYGENILSSWDSDRQLLWDTAADGNAQALFRVSTVNQWTDNTFNQILGSHTSSSWIVSRSIDVPEPSTLAVFALGMIGIASRRFKKQS